MIKLKQIRSKLLLAFGTVLMLSLLLAVWSMYSLFHVLDYKNVNEEFDNINISVLQLRRSEKDFLMREHKNPEFFKTGESKYWKSNSEMIDSIQSRLDDLLKNNTAINMELESSIHDLKEYLDIYTVSFNKLAKKTMDRGFKDWGDEGELRASIHAVETSNYPYDKVLMLMLRRHEKDFFLRKDISYQEKFNDGIEDFKDSVLGLNSDSTVDANRDEILINIDNYKEKFAQIVEAEKQMGLSASEGLLGELREAVHLVEPLLEEMSTSIRLKTETVVDRTIVLILFAVILQLIIGIILAIFFSKSFTTNTIQIKNAIVQLSDGEYPDEVQVTTSDEFGEAQGALNNLVERVKTAAEFAEKIGNGNLDSEYNENYQNDVLAKALLNMHEKLVVAANEDEKRNWTTTGLANFGEILRSNQENVDELSNQIISSIIKYLKANQGALFIVNDEDVDNPHLELTACYAWDKQKFIKKTVNRGEGLAGQVWLERKSLYLIDIPENYVQITSGLGAACPNALLVVPLIINEEVYGILEIASFNKFKTHEIEFVEKLGESIAATLSGSKMNAKTKNLLETAQQQTEELRAQEEEMRQNTEELQATQEEMERQKSELEQEIRELKAKAGMTE